VVAPASADFLVKLAHARADDLLSALGLAQTYVPKLMPKKRSGAGAERGSLKARRRTPATTLAPCDASWTTAPRTASNARLTTPPRSSAMEYTFTLKYQLGADDRGLEALVERLGEAGCHDALVGIGQPGRLALKFTREAADADTAVRSALADMRRAVPSAKLIEMAPDLVGSTDAAEIVGVSRRNSAKSPPT